MSHALLLAIFVSFFALAQEKPLPKPAPVAVAPVIGMGPLQGVINAQAGDYRFFHYDGAMIKKEFLTEIFKTRDTDRQYFLTAVKEINDAFTVLIRDAINYDSKKQSNRDNHSLDARWEDVDGLRVMSDNAIAEANHFTPAKDFLTAVRRFNEAKVLLQTKIESVKSIAGAFPSQTEFTVEGGEAKIPNYGNIKFDEITDYFQKKLDALTEAMNGLPHKVTLASGSPHYININKINEGTGLVLAVENLIPPQEISQLRTQANDLMKIRVAEHDKLVRFTKYSKAFVQNFITTYWDRWRRQEKNIKEGMTEDAQYIARLFWSRSYMRAMYGTRVYGIGVPYREFPANADVYLNTNAAFTKFEQEVVTSPQDIQAKLKAYRNIMNRLDERSAPPVRMGEDLYSGYWYIGANTANIVTWLAGNSNLVQALQMMYRLLSADLYEEYILTEPTGPQKMFEQYRKRYLATPEAKAQAKQLTASYDPDPDDVGEFEAVGVAPGDQMEIFRDTLGVMRDRGNRLQQAKEILAQVAQAESGNTFFQKLKAKKKKLND